MPPAVEGTLPHKYWPGNGFCDNFSRSGVYGRFAENLVTHLNQHAL